LQLRILTLSRLVDPHTLNSNGWVT